MKLTEQMKKKKVVDRYINRKSILSSEEQSTRKAEKVRIRNARNKWEEDTDTYNKELKELNEANGTDEETKIVDRYVPRRGTLSSEEQATRKAEKMRIRNARNKWKEDTDTYNKELKELNEADGTDEETKVVDRYVPRRRK